MPPYLIVSTKFFVDCAEVQLAATVRKAKLYIIFIHFTDGGVQS